MRIQKSFAQTKGVLYVVGTPIGNLQDFSPRAKEILQEVDLIAAEDTRHTRKLLTHFQLSTPLISFHEHNQQSRAPELVERLRKGESIALVSDAGMPGISDPGEVLIQQAVEAGIPVIPVPGPNAAISALVASGLKTDHFVFVGFLPRQQKQRKEELRKWGGIPATLVLYEAPHRLQDLLEDVKEVLGNRRIAVVRELTKMHEEWLRGTVEEVLLHVKEMGTRGEYTVVIEGVEDWSALEEGASQWWSDLTVLEHVEHYLAQGYSKKEAIQKTSQDRGESRREIYQIYHQNEKGKSEPGM
jgi:16S rRNA (cytidine1402-2'-O)-methyltransferase